MSRSVYPSGPRSPLAWDKQLRADGNFRFVAVSLKESRRDNQVIAGRGSLVIGLRVSFGNAPHMATGPAGGLFDSYIHSPSAEASDCSPLPRRSITVPRGRILAVHGVHPIARLRMAGFSIRRSPVRIPSAIGDVKTNFFTQSGSLYQGHVPVPSSHTHGAVAFVR